MTHQRFDPIGHINTPFTADADTPLQTHRSETVGEVVLDEAYSAGLADIDGFSHLYLLYEFDREVTRSTKPNHELRSDGVSVKPFFDDTTHGVFATRSPDRPNPIGLSVVELLDRDENVLRVRGIDVLDGTPLLDIKPYVAAFDRPDDTRAGWLEDAV